MSLFELLSVENEINLTLVAGDVSPRVLSAPSCHDWTFEVRPQPTSLSPCEHRAGREPERGAARTAHLRSSPLTPSAPISANQRFVSSALRPLPSDLECSMSNVECSPSSTLSLRCQGNESQGNPAQSVRTGLNPIPQTSIPLTCGPTFHPLPLALQAPRGERAGERGGPPRQLRAPSSVIILGTNRSLVPQSMVDSRSNCGPVQSFRTA